MTRGLGRGVPAALLLALATAAQVGVSILQQGTAVLSYALGKPLALSLSQAGTLVSATSLGVMFAMLLGGALIDRYGVRPVLLSSALVAVLGGAAIGSQTTYAGLALCLAATGFGLGALPIAGARVIFDGFAGASRGLAMGIRQTGVPLGAAVAAAALPTLALRYGPNAPWLWLALLAAVLNLVLAAAAPHTPRVPSAERPPLGGDLRRIALPALLAFMLSAGQYGLLTYTVPSAPGGLAPAAAGVLLAIAQLGGAAGRIGFGQLSDRLGRRPPVIAIAAGVGALGIALATHLGSVPFVLRGLGYLVAGAGAVGWNALVLTWGGERVSPGRSGQAMGTIGTSVFLGSAVWPPLLGLLAQAEGFTVAWSALAGLIALAAVVALAAGTADRPRNSRLGSTNGGA